MPNFDAIALYRLAVGLDISTLSLDQKNSPVKGWYFVQINLNDSFPLSPIAVCFFALIAGLVPCMFQLFYDYRKLKRAK